jgi:hypothetical protein
MQYVPFFFARPHSEMCDSKFERVRLTEELFTKLILLLKKIKLSLYLSLIFGKFIVRMGVEWEGLRIVSNSGYWYWRC